VKFFSKHAHLSVIQALPSEVSSIFQEFQRQYSSKSTGSICACGKNQLSKSSNIAEISNASASIFISIGSAISTV
jgi:hypothetical protein